MAVDNGVTSSSEPRMPVTATEQAQDDTAISNEGGRPAMSRAWQTERPKPIGKASLVRIPGLKRYGTNLSALNDNIFVSPNNDDSSSSSSSEDEEAYAKETSKKKRRPTNNKAYSKFNVGNDDFKTKGRVSKRDGRLNISVNETGNKGYLAKALGATFLKQADGATSHTTEPVSQRSPEVTITSEIPRPTLNIVVMVIGSRGDIQPFLKLGKCLKEYGHRVRIATHPAFKDFVQKDSGLEFFSVGGDPSELMAFMVKNPGMIPTMDTLKKGEVGRRRDQMAEMFGGFWRACINATDDEKDENNLRMMGDKAPFVADAIIANPPCFAHIHCAERLGIPLHLMFTFPYTPTQAFPHPLANIKRSNVDPGYANFMSYPLVEMMTWQGLGDLVNDFRVKTLGLEPVSTLWAPGQLYRLKVPYTYLWSPGLVPKPSDWGPEIDIAGFVFLDLASSFKPPEDLVKFLEAGEPPVYIGFGSIVVDEPEKFTKTIFEAVEKAGVRALVSKGWGGLGEGDVPESVFMLDNCPHDWLFPKVSGVVHHGGAGTTAIGLKCGKPTMVVPFFGDQQFWGAMIGESGAGPKPVPHKELTVDNLAEGIKYLLSDEAKNAAKKYADDIEKEGDGAENAVTSFHRSLVLRGEHSMRCSILEDRVAVWIWKGSSLRLSALAAELLVEKKKLQWKDLRLIRHCEWNDFEGPGEPITGAGTAIMGTVASAATGVGSVPFKIAKSARKRSRHEDKKRRKSEDAERRKSMTASRKSGEQKNEIAQNEANVKGHPEDTPNGTAHKKANEEPKISSGPTKNVAFTSGPMGKHTESGEPLPQKKECNDEAAHEDDESQLSDDPDNTVAEELATNIGHGVGKTAEAIARAPMDLTLAIAQGFHNAPRLYGDNTVRRPPRITGMKSGLKAAGKEFVFGVYDGVSGLVMQPFSGARSGGALGFVKGVGMGLTGFVLKDIAAIIGPFGYTMKGVQKEIMKSKQPTKFIRKARIVEGQRDLRRLENDPEGGKKAEEAVRHGWSVVEEVAHIFEDERPRGLKGRIHVLRERKTWRANGAFENVEMAQKAIDANRRGESIDQTFREQKKELEKAKRPRKNVVDDLQGGGKVEDEKQIVQKVGDSRPESRDMPNIRT